MGNKTILPLKIIVPVVGIIGLVVLSLFVSWKDVWFRFKEARLLACLRRRKEDLGQDCISLELRILKVL